MLDHESLPVLYGEAVLVQVVVDLHVLSIF